MILEERYNEYKCMVEKAIGKRMEVRDVPYARLWEAMAYSVAAGGKRIRPVLTLEFARLCGGTAWGALPAAVAVELMHTYSLIHDDLPCMDDDDLRRGKPTNHVVFGEYTAVLAGDALQTEAFRAILSSDMPDAVKAECAGRLAEAAGADGMCAGQQLDMDWEGRPLTEEELREIDSRKTGAMIEAACVMGCAAGGGTERQKLAAAKYARSIGLAFQIRDDMLDVLSTDEELGKPIGSDVAEGKTTYMSLLGRERCEELIERLTQEAISAVKEAFIDPDFLAQFASSLAERRN
ncbi:MAG: polyprenyl synthetase family protein [Clostridia bacterium]|nr:polyprenyl synthetase family protein [Clostridia bacterium]